MERPYTGLTALIKINENLLGYIDSVDLSLEKEVIEVIQFGATYKEKTPAIKNWTASCEGTVAFAAGESQHKLFQAYESGELLTLDVMLDETTKFSGKALVSSLSISGSPDDKMSISAEFEGSGGITFTLPQTYNVTITSGVGGTTTPAGALRVASGTSLEITTTPAEGKIADKWYDGTSDEAGQTITGNKFTIASVVADHEIRVTFKNAV